METPRKRSMRKKELEKRLADLQERKGWMENELDERRKEMAVVSSLVLKLLKLKIITKSVLIFPRKYANPTRLCWNTTISGSQVKTEYESAPPLVRFT